jgi:transposase
MSKRQLPRKGGGSALVVLFFLCCARGDPCAVRARKRGGAVGPNPTDRGKPGTKRYLAVDRQGLPLAVGLTGAERPDATVFAAVIDANAPVRGSRGRPRQRPGKVHADTDDDARHCRQYLHRRGITVRIARKGVEDPSRLGRRRWVVERIFGWLNHYRRLAIRYERRVERHQAFLDLACALICLKALRRQAKGLCNE